jgi:uncharacterized membrane protein YkoI
MKSIFSIIIALIFITVQAYSQNIQNKNNIIAIGYFLKPINPKPILFLIFNKSDTLKLLTNKTEILAEIIKPEMIKSLEVSKIKEAVLFEVKNKNWEYVYSNKKNINSLDMTAELKKHKDTVYFNNSKAEIQKYRKIFIGNNHLIIRENGINYYNNNTKLLINTDEFSATPEGFINLKIGYKEAHETIEPLFSFNPHSIPDYSLIFDISTNKILWLAQVDKYIPNNDQNENGRGLYLNKKGHATNESIEIDALTGKVISKHLNDEVEIRIR